MPRPRLTRAVPLRIGIIGGTGLYALPSAEPIDVETPFGNVTLHRTTLGGRETYFLPRHGAQHTVPPHKVNHRAHVEALRSAHCDYIVAVNNVGALDPTLRPNTFAVANDFVDFHRGTQPTFYDDRAIHVDFSQPYCPTASNALARTAKSSLPRVVYAGTDGPRFETPTEIRRLVQAGAQVIGMTGVPEASLAHERGLCYASLCFVGNSAQGPLLSAQKIQQALLRRRSALLKILDAAVRKLPAKKSCHCADATRGAELTLGDR
jgi:5'-methylthioadenosine phosphorylase